MEILHVYYGKYFATHSWLCFAKARVVMLWNDIKNEKVVFKDKKQLREGYANHSENLWFEMEAFQLWWCKYSQLLTSLTWTISSVSHQVRMKYKRILKVVYMMKSKIRKDRCTFFGEWVHISTYTFHSSFFSTNIKIYIEVTCIF